MTTSDSAKLSRRYRSDDDVVQHKPVHVVWEITLACNLKCAHCGSRAGRPRNDELSTAECLNVVDELARLGTREITLIGGEAFLRRDWLEIIAAIAKKEILCGLQTGGRALTEDKIRSAAAAGLKSAGVSIDGLPDLHNQLRGVRSSYDQAIGALRNFRKYGLSGSVNTQITATVIPQLRELMHRIVEAGARLWQVQLTVAMGNAVENDHLLIQPYQINELMPLLAELHESGKSLGLRLVPGNNIGYFGPYEAAWRSISEETSHWQECSAGSTTMGIEADGTIKGCPSLPTSSYRGGNVRDKSLHEIWQHSPQIRQTRERDESSLWSFCRACYYAGVCKGGCTWTTHSLLGRPGNNPFCHFRALGLDKLGLRETIRKVENAGGKPFDHGRFELMIEKKDGTPLENANDIVISPRRPENLGLDASRNLHLCPGCDQFVYPGTVTCPHCHSNIKSLHKLHARREKKTEAIMTEVKELLTNIEYLGTFSPSTDRPSNPEESAHLINDALPRTGRRKKPIG
jgi:radical SAM protein with 4Fe4S-binding SPASM domain